MKENKEIREKLHRIALDAPKSSGVYLWKDDEGTILYVGKAKSLKNRLASYFTSNRDLKTRILVSRAHSIEYITTENEYEALLLENTLIKKHSPRYNINLKDGKTYPVIKITHETFPRVFRTRRIQNDQARYFGPFPNLDAADEFLEFINRNYRIRQCKILKKRTTPCLYFHIGRCSAPCCGKISHEEYTRALDEVALLLTGDTEESINTLETMMKTASKELRFEQAARIRDGIQAIRLLREQNAVVDLDPEDRDYIAWAAEGTMVTFAMLHMRSGRLVARDLYRVLSLKDEEEILTEFLLACYTEPSQVPPHIFVPEGNGLGLAEQWLSQALKVHTHIQAISPDESSAQGPQSPEKRHRAAMAMAAFNAREDVARRLREHGDFSALEELSKLLDMDHLPAVIEGFDIAHIGGRLPVASLISFRNGNPDRKNYRLFRLKTTEGIIDDFASMREVTSRRYTRLVNENAELPDLILIDGGIGQVNAVQGVLSSLNLEIPIIGLAKQDEELYLPGNSIPLTLPRRSDALRLLQRIRDETHRFATTRNQKLRTTENTTLIFEKLPGIGPKKAVKLLKHFHSLEELATQAAQPQGVAKIAEIAGISEEVSRQIVALLPSLIEERIAERVHRSETHPEHGQKKGLRADQIATLAQQAAEGGETYS